MPIARLPRRLTGPTQQGGRAARGFVLAVAACALACAGFVTGSPAQAATAHTTPKAVSPHEIVACELTAEQPFFLTAGGSKLYAQANLGPCTVPPPEECHIVVDLMMKQPQGWYSTVASNDNGWRSCAQKGNHPSVGYNCIVERRDTFITEATLTILYQGQSDSKVTQSAPVTEWC